MSMSMAPEQRHVSLGGAGLGLGVGGGFVMTEEQMQERVSIEEIFSAWCRSPLLLFSRLPASFSI